MVAYSSFLFQMPTFVLPEGPFIIVPFSTRFASKNLNLMNLAEVSTHLVHRHELFGTGLTRDGSFGLMAIFAVHLESSNGAKSGATNGAYAITHVLMLPHIVNSKSTRQLTRKVAFLTFHLFLSFVLYYGVVFHFFPRSKAQSASVALKVNGFYVLVKLMPRAECHFTFAAR